MNLIICQLPLLVLLNGFHSFSVRIVVHESTRPHCELAIWKHKAPAGESRHHQEPKMKSIGMKVKYMILSNVNASIHAHFFLKIWECFVLETDQELLSFCYSSRTLVVTNMYLHIEKTYTCKQAGHNLYTCLLFLL